eukprot:g8247.t1
MQGPSSPQFASQLETGRIITQPSNPINNNGRDNEHNDLIVRVQDILFNERSNNSYIVIDNLGKGSFGQVVRCWCTKSQSFVAVKIIKNQSAYNQQALIEVKILQTLNRSYDVDQHNIVRLLDCFPYHGHLCLVFELLQSNLFELVKTNSYSGLTINLVQFFVRQVLHTLTILRQEHIIHGDLKPENILLKDGNGHIKVIDFGSACMEHETVYSYLQSRFYRSPEVVLYYPYDGAIDMWSLGCIAAELALGLPLFTADSERDLLSRMFEILGPPSLQMLNGSRRLNRYFKRIDNRASLTNRSVVIGGIYQLLDEKEFEERNGEKASTGKKYFGNLNLSEIICRIGVLLDPRTKRRDHNPSCFLDFLHGLLKMDPKERWNAHQASGHPFVTGMSYDGPYRPMPSLEPRTMSRPVGIGQVSERCYSSTWHPRGQDPHSLAHEAALMAVSQLTESVTSNSPNLPGQIPLSAAGSVPRFGVSPEMTTLGRSMGSSFRGSMTMNDPIVQAAINAAKTVASTPTGSLNRPQWQQQQQQSQSSMKGDYSTNKDTMIIGFNVRKPELNCKESTVQQQSPPSASNIGLVGTKDETRTPHSSTTAAAAKEDNDDGFTFQQRNDYAETNFSKGLFENPLNSRSNQNHQTGNELNRQPGRRPEQVVIKEEEHEECTNRLEKLTLNPTKFQ